MKEGANSGGDQRKSITIRLTEGEARALESAARRARSTRQEFGRSRLLVMPSEDAPILAVIDNLIALHGRLDRTGQLDDELRQEILSSVRALSPLARAEANRWS